MDVRGKDMDISWGPQIEIGRIAQQGLELKDPGVGLVVLGLALFFLENQLSSEVVKADLLSENEQLRLRLRQ